MNGFATMGKRSKLAVALLLTACVGYVVWQGLGLREPRHAGKPLSLWLNLLAQNNLNTRTQAVSAVRSMGADAVPHLSRLANARDSRLKARMMDWADRWSLDIKFTVAATRHAQAAAGFAVLDEAVSSPAIPRLLRSLNDGETAPGAAEALLAIGQSGLLSLTNCIHHADNRVRLAIATSVGRSAVGGCPKLKDHEQKEQVANVFIPVCLNYLTDRDSDVRAQAAQALGWFCRQPTLVVPALAGLLTDGEYFPRSVACQALANFGEPAKAALPALREYATQAKGASEREMAVAAIVRLEALGPLEGKRP